MWQLFTPPAVPPFERKQYRCYPISFKRNDLEGGDKVLLPGSALDQLARLQVSYPMMFQITNPALGGSTHCGVMEFSAEEGCAYVPHWMMENLLLQPGEIIVFSNVTLPKATFVQLQPHLTKFTELSNPRVVLEKALRNFTCLTKGDRIVIAFGDTKYELDVREVKPGNAVSIIETDVNVDFFEPRDYKDYEAKRLAEVARLADLRAQAEKEASKLTQASPALKGASPAGPSSSSEYFAKLGTGNKLVTRKKATPSSTPSTSSASGLPHPPAYSLGEEKVTIHSAGPRSTGGTINSVPPTSSSFLGSSSSSSSSSSSNVRTGNSGASRLLNGVGSTGASASSGVGNVSTTAPAASKFTFVYKDEGNKKKLMRREIKPTGFTPFAGAGHSLKPEK